MKKLIALLFVFGLLTTIGCGGATKQGTSTVTKPSGDTKPAETKPS